MAGFKTLVVLQSTSFCNINCDYCYLPHRSINNRMTIEVLEVIAKEVFKSSLVTKSLDFVWHLGEPLAVPVSYYEQAFSMILRLSEIYEKQVSFSFQTNAMLIN